MICFVKSIPRSCRIQENAVDPLSWRTPVPVLVCPSLASNEELTETAPQTAVAAAGPDGLIEAQVLSPFDLNL